MILICEECFHPLDHWPHICLIRTCPSCFSSKSIFDRYCLDCKEAVPCHYCPNPSSHNIQHIKLCYSHLLRFCNIYVFQNQLKRALKNEDYNTKILRRRALKLGKSGAPRLAEL